MSVISREQVAEAVVRRAQRQGYVVARDIRSELRLAGLPEAHLKAILQLAGPALVRRRGRYYHKDVYSPRLEQEHIRQEAIHKVIRALIKEHRARTRQDERRSQNRVDFIQPVQVQTEDGKQHQLLSRDISPTGIRLLGSRQLLGHKVHVLLPQGAGLAPCRLLTRILWTCAVGDELFENGGAFLELIDNDAGSGAQVPST